MDNEYEIDSFAFDGEEVSAVPEQEPEQRPKASPFADSPYVMNEQPQDDSWEMPAAPQKKKGKVGKRIVAAVAVVALVAAGCGITSLSLNSYWLERSKENQQLIDQLSDKLEDLQQQINDKSYTGNGNSISGSVNTSGEGMTPGQVYAKNVNSVVFISAVNSGSGFIISPDGYIVSNYHVVEGATRVKVITNDEQQYDAKVVGYDSANDVAVLKVEATGLQAAVLGSSDDLIVGDQVVAIGHPLGNETPTLTVGYVSAKDQSVSTDGTIMNMLQTDAAINSGNSGGPLFNMKGEVVGITTAKYSGTTTSGASIESIGFAIPIDDVVKKMQDLIDYGYVTGAYLGVSVMNMNAEILDAFGFPEGAYVAETTPGSCAEAAGVQAKDMIVAVGQYEVDSVNGLTRALAKFKPGDTTTITVWRAGRELELPITLDERPAPESTDEPQATQPQPTQPQNESAGNWWDHFFGD